MTITLTVDDLSVILSQYFSSYGKGPDEDNWKYNSVAWNDDAIFANFVLSTENEE